MELWNMHICKNRHLGSPSSSWTCAFVDNQHMEQGRFFQALLLASESVETALVFHNVLRQKPSFATAHSQSFSGEHEMSYAE